jgi:signal transduction histidine kinase
MTKEAYIQRQVNAVFHTWSVRASLSGAVIFLLLAGLDAVVVPEQAATFFLYRSVTAAALIVCGVFLNRHPVSPALNRMLIYAAVLGSAATISLMILKTGGHSSPYYVGVILVSVAVIGFIPGRFSMHAMLAGIIYLTYLLPILLFDLIIDHRTFFMENAFLVMILATLLFQRYLSDRAFERELAQRYELDQYRFHLEEVVAARTNALGEAVEGLQREIEGRKRTEESLRRTAAELRERNEELNWFAYSIAHDLREPLINIRGFASEITKGLQDVLQNTGTAEPGAGYGALAADIPAAVGFVNAAVDRMSGRINAMLKLFRIMSRELNPERVDLDEVVRACLRNLEGLLALKGIRVDALSLPTVVGDRASLREIMQRLLDNAVTYHAAGRSGVVEIRGETTAEGTLITVRDNGKGIAPHDIPKVFEIFRRAGMQDVPGEGMGLAYAKALVRRHGGRIWCESEEGQGSAFHFSLPVAGPTELTALPESLRREDIA